MKIIIQHDQMDCGVASLAMITSHYGKNYSLQYLRELCYLTKSGVSLLGICEAADKIGLEKYPVMLSFDQLLSKNVRFPAILHWNKNHFVVLRSVKKNPLTGKRSFRIADPAHGAITLSEDKFLESWLGGNEKGIVLMLNPTVEFYQKEVVSEKVVRMAYLLRYLAPHRKQLLIMSLLLLAGSGLSLIFPFLTQQLIDRGVNAKDIHFINIILLSQLAIYLGTITIEIFRNWLMLYVGTKLSIAVISEFLKKVLKLPLKFFDTKMIGDFQQRIQDNERIEEFLTSQSLTTAFSIITFSVFFGVLWYYDTLILAVYLALTALSIGWSIYWLRKRKQLDYLRFQQQSSNQESIQEIIRGIDEMKLNDFEDYKCKEWEGIQEKLFSVNIRILKINQLQSSGFEFINQVKNILVTFLAAKYVVEGTMSLGALLSVSYIIGQMNAPVTQLITFFRSLQDAKLSLERLNEVQNHVVEEQPFLLPLEELSPESDNRTIQMNNLSFQYEGPQSPFVLKDITLTIPKGKITAIVGASGSGKTTLMKLLLKFYPPSEGSVLFGNTDINELSPKSIRINSGVVMQDGFIFSDTIERNIVTGHENIDRERLQRAAKIANIETYIESLPMKYQTKIGASGNGLSGGQKQRFLIARAVYKNPDYIFFDEATSALDAENEKIIHTNLQSFFQKKTVVLIAHRLSTVKNADQIIVLKNGQIIETGTHSDLVDKRGDYFNLIKNQLELGN